MRFTTARRLATVAVATAALPLLAGCLGSGDNTAADPSDREFNTPCGVPESDSPQQVALPYDSSSKSQPELDGLLGVWVGTDAACLEPYWNFNDEEWAVTKVSTVATVSAPDEHPVQVETTATGFDEDNASVPVLVPHASCLDITSTVTAVHKATDKVATWTASGTRGNACTN